MRHFSRRDVPQYQADAGTFKRRSKHGNYNAWVDTHGADYDVLLSVDTGGGFGDLLTEPQPDAVAEPEPSSTSSTAPVRSTMSSAWVWRISRSVRVW